MKKTMITLLAVVFAASIAFAAEQPAPAATKIKAVVTNASATPVSGTAVSVVKHAKKTKHTKKTTASVKKVSKETNEAVAEETKEATTDKKEVGEKEEGKEDKTEK